MVRGDSRKEEKGQAWGGKEILMLYKEVDVVLREITEI